MSKLSFKNSLILLTTALLVVSGFFVANSAQAYTYTSTDFAAFDGVNIGTNGYTLSSGIHTTYDSGTGTELDPVNLTLTGNAPIVTPWFGPTWTTYNYVTIGIPLPTDFAGTPSVYQTGIIRNDSPYNGVGYKMSTIGDGSTPLATAGAAAGYLDYSFAANSNNTKTAGLVKLQVIWNADSTPEYFTIDINGLQLDTLTDKFVSTIEQLKAALADTNVTTINITADISGITEELIVGHAVTINGGDHTLTFTSALNTLANGHRDGIFVMANETTINNLSVAMAGEAGWQGVYGIQFYGVTGGVVNNYTGTGADAALLINGSAVELTGATTVSGNEFGGIEVSKGSLPPTNSILTVTGTLVNTTEAYGKPTIWLVTTQGAVTGANVPSATNTTLKVDQTQYYLTAGNAILDTIPPTATVIHDETAKTITYTFSEPMQLTNNDGSPITGTIASKLAVYQVTGLDYTTASLVPGINITNASLVGNVLTITYTGTLVDQTNIKYIVDAWGYKISDLAGNKMLPAESAMFTVTGVDTIAPVITMLGEATVNLNVGDSYTDAGATASDNVDGDLTASIVKGGTFVDTTTAGTYTITYNVSDATDNAATQVTRTVNVVAASNGGGGGGGGGVAYYSISASTGANGSISPIGSTSVASGNSQTYVITPATGYQVASVLVDGTSVGTLTTYTFSNVTTDHTISATFAVTGTVSAASTIIGDINGDGKIDEYDFAIMMSQWGETGTGLSADLNHDNVVDESDFAILMVNWGL